MCGMLGAVSSGKARRTDGGGGALEIRRPSPSHLLLPRSVPYRARRCRRGIAQMLALPHRPHLGSNRIFLPFSYAVRRTRTLEIENRPTAGARVEEREERVQRSRPAFYKFGNFAT
jgi:hypothetical protein